MAAEVLTVNNALYYGIMLAVGLFCWFQWKYRDLLRAAAKIPVTFPAWPLLGHGYFMFWGLEEGTRYIIEMSRRTIEKGYKIACFWCGPLPYFVIHNMEDIQTIMTSANTLDKGEEYEYFKVGLDSGVGPFKYSLVTAPGPVWKVSRRHLNCLFVPRNLEQMMPIFNINSKAMMVRLDDHVGRAPKKLNIMDFTLDTSLKTICDFLFGPGNNITINSKEFLGLKSVVERVPEIFIKRVTTPWLRWDPIFLFFYKKELQEVNECWKKFTEAPLKVTKDMYELKRKNGKTTKEITKNGEMEEEEGLMNIVDVYRPFQEKNPQFTEADMRGEMLTLYETGSDTVAAITSFCLMSLAQYPECQDKLYNEVCSVAGLEGDVTMDHIARLQYLDQCLKETLRRFTLVPYLLRKTAEEIKLSTCTIPAGHTVVMSLNAIHMNPRIYPDPEVFDPERFSPEKVANRDRFTFVPFSGGPRDCIGKRYGMLIMKVMMVHILRKYRVNPVADIHKLKRRLVVALVSSEGYYVELEPRS